MDKKAEESLMKLGEAQAKSFIENEYNNEALVKKADEIISELGVDQIGFFKEAEAIGKGIAIGEVLSKQAGIGDEVYDYVYGQFMSATKEVFGEKVANEIDAGLNEASEKVDDSQIAEIKEKIEEGVTPVIVEALGGEEKLKEAIKENPELAKEVVGKIDEVVNEVVVNISNSEETALAEPEKTIE